MDKQAYKTLAMWAKDDRCFYTYLTLWKAVKNRRLKATRPKNGSKWIVSEVDFLEFINGESNI